MPALESAAVADPPPRPRFYAVQINAPDNPDNDPYGPQLDTRAFGINDCGDVVGITERVGGSHVGLLYLHAANANYSLGSGQYMLHFDSSGSDPGHAWAINKHGRIAGVRENSVGGSVYLHVWNLPAYSSGLIVGDAIHPHVSGRVGINDDDVVICTASSGNDVFGYQIQWDPVSVGSPATLVPVDLWQWSLTGAIGDTGLIGGWVHGYTGVSPCGGSACSGFAIPGVNGARWSAPQTANLLEPLTNLQTCEDPPQPFPNQREPFGINKDDRIVGRGHLAYGSWWQGSCPSVATLWVAPNAPPLELPWPYEAHTVARAISDPTDDGRVLIAGQDEFQELAVLWEALNSVIDAGSPSDWTALDLSDPGITDLSGTQFKFLLDATGVNTMGWVTGRGELRSSSPPGPVRAFLLVPTDSCPGDLDHDGKVDVFDLQILLAAWGQCPTVIDEECDCCTGGNGSGGGCSSSTCEAAVCAKDAFCCEHAWVSNCDALAAALCRCCDASVYHYCWADINNSGSVDTLDLLALLASWGNCPGYACAREIEEPPSMLYESYLEEY
jgi:hypothetical protein